MSSTSANITAPAISYPKGGGALTGISERTSHDPFTGALRLEIPIPVSLARGFEPELSISYNSGAGNGLFGMGFDLGLPNITRRTNLGIPRYTDEDHYLLDNTHTLVPCLDEVTGLVTKYEQELNGIIYIVQQYMPVHNSDFPLIESLTDPATGIIFWRNTTRDNITYVYGQSAQSRIADPASGTAIFQWLIEKVYDAKGNTIQYLYKEDNLVNLPDKAFAEQHKYINKYIERIRYGNYIDTSGNEAFAFENVFVYQATDVANPRPDISQLNNNWDYRQDAFSSCRSGFEIRTARICQYILLYHCIESPVPGYPYLVKSLTLDYTPDQYTQISFLQSVILTGHRIDKDLVCTTQAMPPLLIGFTSFLPEQQVFHPLTNTAGRKIKGTLGADDWSMTDLYNEGLPGILYTGKPYPAYCAPDGNGTYLDKIPLSSFPVQNRDAGSVLSDINSNMKWDVLINQAPFAGSFEQTDRDRWSPYKSFRSIPFDLNNPALQLVDVTGNGRADVVIMSRERITYYNSEGDQGFSAPAYCANPGLPSPDLSSATQLIFFGDMTGDGLSDLVWVRNGLVEYWPNLGYGRFGEKVSMNDCPRMDASWDTRQIFQGDITGSGTLDLVIAYHDHLTIFFNQQGNSFSEGCMIPLPQQYTDSDTITLSDVTGTGTTSIILSKGLTAQRQDYFDPCGGVKPYLLNSIQNNLGSASEFTYCSSTYYYLQDRDRNKPWITSLPFPVQVIQRFEHKDLISGVYAINEFSYHEGFYDDVLKEFAGFGYIEQWDSRQYGDYLTLSAASGIVYNADELSPPAYSRHWFHTGSYTKQTTLSKQFQSQYFSGDHLALLMPDSTIRDNGKILPYRALNQAASALRGKLLRTEQYGMDGSPVEANPYKVVETNYTIVVTQAGNTTVRDTFCVYPRETITYNYERNPADPRVTHQFNLIADEYGNITRSCEVAYARRKITDKEYELPQRELKAILTCNQFINSTTPFYLLGVPAEEQSLELAGMTLSNSLYFTLAEVETFAITALSNQVAFQQPFSPGQVQARIFSWEEYYYWNESQDLPLPFKEVASRTLLHHIEQAIVSPQEVTDLYGGKLDDVDIQSAGYFLKQDAQPEKTYWWDPGVTQYYYKNTDNKYYLLCRATTALGSDTQLSYDLYSLRESAVIKIISETQKNVTVAVTDYFALQPSSVTDENNNITQIRYDQLGQARVISLHAVKFDKWVGDGDLAQYNLLDATMEQIIATPEKYLQDATTFYFYDLKLWENKQLPVTLISLKRFTHVSDLPPHTQSEISIALTYFDGDSRIIEKKLQASPEPNNEVVLPLWIARDRIIYNNKAEPLKQYKPFYTNNPYYETEKEAAAQGAVYDTILYDALGREIKTYTPKADLARAFFSENKITAWNILSYDQDDKVIDSAYYQQYIHSTDPNIRESLEKAAVFYDTPQEQGLNVQGFVFKENACLNSKLQPSKVPLDTVYEVDITGRIIAASDPRLAAESVENIAYRYNMAGKVMQIKSADAGLHLQFFNIAGKMAFSWSASGVECVYAYDTLLRLTTTTVIRTDEQWLVVSQNVEKIIYGEGQPDDQNYNLRGNISQHYDQAGLVHFLSYNLDDYASYINRRVLKDYTKDPDWRTGNEQQLETEIFSTIFVFDALGNLLSKQTPDQSLWEASYTFQSTVAKVDISVPNLSLSSLISHIAYAATDQQLSVTYGNGVSTEFSLEAGTFNLSGIHTKKIADGVALQDLTYYYDPEDNVTSEVNRAGLAIFCSPPAVNPLRKFEYDSLYRMIESSGREATEIKEDTYQNGFKQSIFIPLCPVAGSDASPAPLAEYTESYQYDYSGNLTLQTHKGVAEWKRETVMAERSNRGVLKNMIAPGKKPDDYFDSNGNMISMENIESLSWNYRQNIDHASTNHSPDGYSNKDYYQYDSTGQRVRKVVERYVNSLLVATADFVYIDQFIVCTIKDFSRGVDNPPTVIRNNTILLGDGTRVVAVASYSSDDPAVSIRFQYEDNIGSAALELDEGANVLSYEEFYAFGGTAFIAGEKEKLVAPKHFRYSFEECDDSTGLYYYGERYYASWAARWLSTDPAWEINGLNLYEFLAENAMDSIDVGGEGKVIEFGTAANPGGKLILKKLSKTAIYRPRSTNTGSGISRRYPVTSPKYRAKINNKMPKVRKEYTMFGKSMPTGMMGLVRGHLIPHADTVVDKPAGAPANYVMSTLHLDNYYPEPEGWGEVQRKHREAKARERETPIAQFTLYGSEKTAGGHKIPSEIVFVELRGLSNKLPASKVKSYNIKAYRVVYAGFDYDKLNKVPGSDRRRTKQLRVYDMPQTLKDQIMAAYPGYAWKF